MTATLDPTRPAHGGPAAAWSPRRLGHHRYLWWAGALVLAGAAAAIAVGLDRSPGPGIADDRAVDVLTVVVLAVPFLLWGLVHQGISAVRRRVRDDVRVYGVGQSVVVRAVADEGVRYVVDVDHAPAAVSVRDRKDPGGPSSWLDDGARRLRLRARARQMTASTADGPVFVARRSGPAGRRQWEIAVEGMRLRCEVRGTMPVPRRTLVDDDGEAWLVTVGRARRGRVLPRARVPERLSPAAAAFVVWVVAEIDAKVRAARETPLTSGGDGDSGDSSWWDTGDSGSTADDAGSSPGSTD
ncbi:hypothetical protein ACR9E3_23625 [Actinomycetospora sp. C-140]